MSPARRPVTEVPRIETERLVLRGRRRADFEPYARMWADLEVARFTSGAPLAREDAWMRFGRSAGLWTLTGYGSWVVEEKSGGRFVGDVGPADYGRDIEPSLAGKPEFGWVISPAFQGAGFASEATRAALAWTEAKFPHTIFSCIISPENAASIRVAAKLGFLEVARTTYRGKAINVYERLPPS